MIDEMKLDPLTADRLKSLMQAKFKAVECEDFEEAKRLKIVIDKLKAAGGQLKELEERKIISVKQED
jgi:centrosomal protein CEP104